MADQLLRSGFRFYQSANADAESIKEGFIIRQHEYEIIIEDIRRNKMEGAVQHYLLLGRRGSGKSTLLKRVQVEIETDEQLANKFIAINLAEEQANIYRLSDLWEEILQEMEHAGIDVTYPNWEEDMQSYSHKLASSVHEAVYTSGKKVILLLDNIDRIFENLKEGASMLREYLLNFDDLKIIGGSTRMTEYFWRYDLPFYEFFRILRLEPLSSEEVKKLLLYWSEKLEEDKLKEFVEKQTGQLETIRILTDGLPRTLQFFVNILLTHGPETGYEYLRLIMDQVTPLYQERLNSLPPSQRKIVLQMAFLWESSGAKEIADATHMDNKVISAQLKQLIDKGIADRIETDNKNHLYRLSERFFNLWLIFTQGSPSEKRKAKCLTVFLENFYSPDELKQLVTDHLQRLQSNEWHPNKLALITKAIAQSKYISSYERDELIRHTISLKNIDYELKQQLPLLTTEINEKVLVAIKNQDWPKSMRLIKEIEQEDEKKWGMLGYVYYRKNDFADAEKYYLMAAEKGNKHVLFFLGNLYKIQKRFDDAEKYYLMINERDSMRMLAYVYEEQHRLTEAEKYYLKAIEQGDDESIFHLAYLYEIEKRFAEAEKCYLKAIDSGDKEALFFLASMYDSQQRYGEAEKYYLLATENNDPDASIFLAGLYRIQGKTKQAEKYYLEAYKIGHEDAAFSLGNFYYEQVKLKEAEKYYFSAVQNNNNMAMYTLSIVYYRLNEKKLEAKKLLDNFKSEKNAYMENTFKMVVNLWNGYAKEASLDLKKFITENIMIKEANEYLPVTLTHFLIHHQVNFVSGLFMDDVFGAKLKENYQPIYYAVEVLAKKDKNMLLRIPPEIKEIVDNILEEIQGLQKFYYGK